MKTVTRILRKRSGAARVPAGAALAAYRSQTTNLTGERVLVRGEDVTGTNGETEDQRQGHQQAGIHEH